MASLDLERGVQRYRYTDNARAWVSARTLQLQQHAAVDDSDAGVTAR